MKKFAKIISLLLVMVLVLGLVASCKPVDTGEYTYNDVFITSPGTWNPHTYESNDDSYVLTFINMGLYEFFFNETYDGYYVKPCMAAEEPIDVTTKLKSTAKWGIPSDATSGYAYRIPLNRDARWDDGTRINADTYIYSMMRLLDPDLMNHRASSYYQGSLVIKNAKNYFSGTMVYDPLVETEESEWTDELFFTLTKEIAFFGDTAKSYFDRANYKSAFDLAAGGNLYDKYIGQANAAGYIPLTAQAKADILEVSNNFGDDNPEAWLEWCASGRPITKTNFEDVGIYKSGEYEITIVLEKSLKGFYLLYNLTSNWIVYEPLYEANLKQVGLTYQSSYCTSLETSMGYGPYKLTSYQIDKEITFARNNDWFGIKNTRKYPEYKEMFNATKVVSTCVKEASTRKEMFLKGQLETYGLQAADYADYRSSDYLYFSPGITVFFLILNGYETALKSTQSTLTNVNKTILLNQNFRRAMGVSFDKDEFCATLSPARKGAFGIIGEAYIYDVDTGDTYRSTPQAKQVLCDFYGVTYGATEKYKTLDEAYDAITGYNPTLAKEWFLKAYEEELAAGKIKATDKIVLTYSASSVTEFLTNTLAFLNDKLNIILKGTVLENRIVFEIKETGSNWSKEVRAGTADSVLAGWTGGIMDPFSLMEVYVNPTYQYDANWFDAKTSNLTLTLPGYNNGQPITMSLFDWYNVLNGEQIGSYNFGFEQAPANVRLSILAGMEGFILQTYNYLPMMQDASGFLLSQKVQYITEAYHPVMARGGINYIKFLFNDAEWEAYVQQQGGTLEYK